MSSAVLPVVPAQATRFTPALVPRVVYPDSDGLPMSDNTLQFKWINMVAAGFHRLFQDRPDVFVASDLLWYYVEGDPKMRLAPDTMIAFGRPAGDRGSYKQWEEENVAPQVVFEILSPGNSVHEMRRKAHTYEKLGVEEYYEFNPDNGDLDGYCRTQGEWKLIDNMQGWVSPRTGVTFATDGLDLIIKRPDGQPFLKYHELVTAPDEAEYQRKEAATQRAIAETERARAEASEFQVEQLAAKLRELGVDPSTVLPGKP